MTGVLVASAVLVLLAACARGRFAWDDGMSRLVVASAALVLVMCSSLLFDGRWAGALALAPLGAMLAAAAVAMGHLPRRPDPRDDDPEDDDGPGGGGTPPAVPPPAPPGSGIDWEAFDAARASWRRTGSHSRS